jgi:hypothetical protein
MQRFYIVVLIFAALLMSGCGDALKSRPAPMLSITIDKDRHFMPQFTIVSGPVEDSDAVKSGGNIEFQKSSLETPLHKSGTVAFWFKSDRLFRSTFEPATLDQEFISIDGLARFVFHAKDKGDNCPSIYMYWDESITGISHLAALLPEIPADTWIHAAFTWDSESGLANAYVNGTPIKTISSVSKWQINKPASSITVKSGTLPLADISIYNEYLSGSQISSMVYEPHKGALDRQLGAVPLGNISDRDIDTLRGELVYDNPLNKPSSINDWRMEGPGNIAFESGWMTMASDMADKGSPVEGHIVNWCDKDMPENFIAEWDFRMISEYGLTISFFCAKGVDGQDIFSPELAPRDGTFSGYVRGDIDNYHISYQASTQDFQGRAGSHIRKNSGFALASKGPIGVAPGSKKVHKITLIKNGPHIQMAVDGNLIIDFLEDGSLGDVHGSGKIGFRQMKWTKAAYRDFKVYRIK